MSALPPKADMCSALAYVCFWANSGLMQRSKRSLFDQLVGERKQIRRDIEAERFGGGKVDDEEMFRKALFHRHACERESSGNVRGCLGA